MDITEQLPISTVEYLYLADALKREWETFRQLISEMESFAPMTNQEFAAQRTALLERVQMDNPTLSREQLVAFVDSQLNPKMSPEWQFRSAFSRRLICCETVAVMLSQALLEGMINHVLAQGLANAGKSELFDLVDKWEIRNKWLHGPKLFNSKFYFPTGNILHETFGKLVKVRNGVVHSKIDMWHGSTQVYKGNSAKEQSYKDTIKWIVRYMNLPFDLAELMLGQIPELGILIIANRDPIARNIKVSSL